MDDLRDRFGRLDRVEAPDLWSEVVARAAELEAVPVRPATLRPILVALALLAALAGAIAIGSWLTRPAPDALTLFDNGMIVGQHECQLLAIDPASNEARQLVPSPRDCSDGEHPPAYTAWSADGRYLAYLVARHCGACFEDFPREVIDEAGPWLYDTETGVTGQLAACPMRYCESLAMSPDGALVAYIAHRGSRESRAALIVTEVADGGASYQVDLGAFAGQPRFSPDGLHIVLATTIRNAAGLYSIDVADITSGAPTEGPEMTLLHGGDGLGNPAWSPDGASIAFEMTDADGGGGIWLIRSDGTDPRPVAVADAEPPAAPAWSPDGTFIAYVRTSGHGSPNTPGKLQIWTVSSQGGEPTMLYESACCIGDWSGPTWSPDGEFIAFSVEIRFGIETGVGIIRPDGTGLQFLSAEDFTPDWQPLPVASPGE